jgi:Na+/proline symporter
MFAQNLSSGTHADQATGVMGACYEIGLSGIWCQWMWLFTTPLYRIVSPVFRRLRLVTTADFFELRYERSLAILYSWSALYVTMVSVAMIIKAVATTVQAISGFSSISIMCVVSAAFLSFASAGGLVAAATTDFVQSVFIAFLSFVALPFGFHMVGGIKGLSARLPPQMFTLVGPHEMTWFTVGTLIVVGAVGVVAQPGMMTENASAKTEMNSRIGSTYGNFFKRACTIGWALTGLLGVALSPGLNTAHREQILGIVTVRLLPHGFASLMIAAILATVMRIATLAIAFGGLALAILLPSGVAGMVRFVTALPFLGVPIWIGIFWRGENRYGAWVSAVGSALIHCGCGAMGLHFTVCSLLSLVFGIARIIVVSLLTTPEPAESLEKIIATLRVPVGDETERGLVPVNALAGQTVL